MENEEMQAQESFAMTVTTRQVEDIAAVFQREMLLYEAAMELVESKLHTLIREFRLRADRSPIDNLQSRIKSPQSIMDKLQRKGHPMSLQSMEHNILDIAGVRIVCPFLQDVYKVADMLLRHDDIRLVQIKDYIKEPKPNGYRSLHVIITVDVNLSDSCHAVPVELQIRTIAMNCWASTEHQLHYKKDFPMNSEDAEQLRECAELMRIADEKMQRLAEKLLPPE